MGIRGLFEGWHIVILIALVIVVFGWKRLPDAARSVGRSMRILKSEVNEMKSEGKSTPSAASSDTVRGETVRDATPQEPHPAGEPTQPPAPSAQQAPAAQQPHHQPPA